MKIALYVCAAADLFACVIAAAFCAVAFRGDMFYLAGLDAVMCLIWTHKFISTLEVISRS